MKFRKSITKKLFIVNAIIFAAFILSTLIIQTLFFEKFYINKKKSELRGMMQKFKSSYTNAKSDGELDSIINELQDEYGYKIVIIDGFGRIKPNIYSFDVRDEIDKNRIIREISLYVRNTNLLEDIMSKDGITTYVTENKVFARRNIICAFYSKQNNEFVFTMASFQPIDEAVSVIREFYVYFFIGAIVIVVSLSLVYSNMITKPLIEINRTATKMAKLDFGEKCRVNSDDEIGNLAASLNFLSENLNNALTSLRGAKEKLEEDIVKERKLEKMRREFIAAVSHELKTPINLIGGYAEGLKDDIFEDKDKEYYLDVIIDESKKMGNLVSDMLDLSQLESGNFKLAKEEFYIDKLIGTTVKKLTGIINQKKIDITMNLIDDIKVFADWNRIEQVITNYLTNAIRHTDNNGSITINMKDADNNVIVEVINTGDKIPEDEIANIWDKFYKIDKSRNRSLGGTGIGLAIVKNIMLLHEGSFGAENTEDGVKFYFSLKKA
ncbi:sensor histidine kinase [Fonticella tunisiensis]|uniref:histidine kinase n=1 Tax=Fonticella tunisiensis TaxID=1096341 RepID=A0A4R7KU83_9CLOT|nr:sensor histidine kinase [Fonticella tunisiensis]TDT63717.1 signal transduction histidine kinase [Fonticella tunisiensis]